MNEFKFELGQVVNHKSATERFGTKFLIISRGKWESLGSPKENMYRVKSHNTHTQEWMEGEIVAIDEDKNPE